MTAYPEDCTLLVCCEDGYRTELSLRPDTREEPCDELRRRWRLSRDFDQGRVYTGRWGAIPRGSVWPVAEVNEDA